MDAICIITTYSCFKMVLLNQQVLIVISLCHTTIANSCMSQPIGKQLGTVQRKHKKINLNCVLWDSYTNCFRRKRIQYFHSAEDKVAFISIASLDSTISNIIRISYDLINENFVLNYSTFSMFYLLISMFYLLTMLYSNYNS